MNWLTVMPMDIPHSTPVHAGNYKVIRDGIGRIVTNQYKKRSLYLTKDRTARMAAFWMQASTPPTPAAAQHLRHTTAIAVVSDSRSGHQKRIRKTASKATERHDEIGVPERQRSDRS